MALFFRFDSGCFESQPENLGFASERVEYCGRLDTLPGSFVFEGYTTTLLRFARREGVLSS